MDNLDTYQKRLDYQTQEWVKGNSIHNTVDDECCPDFSCCTPELKAPEEHRKMFAAALKVFAAASRDQQKYMLFKILVETSKNVAYHLSEHVYDTKQHMDSDEFIRIITDHIKTLTNWINVESNDHLRSMVDKLISLACQTSLQLCDVKVKNVADSHMKVLDATEKMVEIYKRYGKITGSPSRGRKYPQ